MTRLGAFLEDFGAAPARPEAGPVLHDDNALETARLEAFESGYRAGWDDAIKAQNDDHARIASDFAQNLQDLSFTYHEAYSQVLNGIAPLLEDVVGTLLPALLRETLGPHIAEQLRAMAREIGALDVVIAVAPGSAETVLPLLETDFGFPLKLAEDGTLAEGQADIRFGDIEKQIDLSGLVRDVAQAVQGFVHDNRRKTANG
ncbi:ABC transporter ATP-binding protein [Salipiger sp. P9]|uniref:ABC transporter ATP-binding protein n=1 Tax=Salipiger pentaromativorans TaxID=2943193 RepID=UPI0021580EA1|nr:ABC transporter ATP-binding protein [Salipiger pentaromativorans]MCR8548812.1 ABC transporter ATP-binding protein [Salipiger pentaromativorans]